jgi:DNA anti-recombination protein RmuC
MSLRTHELKQRVEEKRHQLEAQLARLKAEGAGRAADELDSIKARLKEVRASLASGWDKMTNEAVRTLSAWLKEK